MRVDVLDGFPGDPSTDEYIIVSDFLKMIEIYAATIIEWCGAEKA
jgi:hypothetical protein